MFASLSLTLLEWCLFRLFVFYEKKEKGESERERERCVSYHRVQQQTVGHIRMKIYLQLKVWIVLDASNFYMCCGSNNCLCVGSVLCVCY